MRQVQITATVNVPLLATQAQVKEWIAHTLGCTDSINNNNPLSDIDEITASEVQINKIKKR